MPKKIEQALTSFGLRTSVMAVASCLALTGIPSVGYAAGLGKVVVFSALGQPLRAEIEVTATREELADMKAQLAPPEAFRQAGLDYATSLVDIRFSLDKRAKGASVIKLSSDRPINDPFIDMLLQLDWSAGRLIREYTFLLDPPEMAAKAAVPVTPAVAKSTSTKPVAQVGSSAAAIDEEVRSKALARVREQKPAEGAVRASSGNASTHLVKSGETLHRIAGLTKPDGVSLEQMLVGLLRANQDAFDGGNMNRLKAGKILSIPEKSAIEGVSSDEARKVVIAQSSDWRAYQNRLAGLAGKSAVVEDEGNQESAGKISAKVEEPTAATASPNDQLRVSKNNASPAKPAAKGPSGRSEEDLIAKEKALSEANDRVEALERNVADLQKLLEMKSQALAELQKQAASEPAATGIAAPAAPEKQAEMPAAPAAAEPPQALVPPKEVKTVETKPADSVVATEVKTPTQPPPAEPKAAEPAKVAAPPPPPVPLEEPGFFAGLLDNPMTLPAGGGLLALIAAYFVARRRRASKEEVPLELSSTLSPQSANMSGNSVFRSTGGQSVDTSHTPAQTDFSQAGPGSIDTDEVDPVAEADVYMAYGRDAQAEEILLEAKQKDPKRHAIHVKLLEIYSNRKDVKQFETLATDLYGETGGSGPDWVKAAALGALLIPDNPLFGGSVSPKAPAPAADLSSDDLDLAVPELVVPQAATPPVAADEANSPADDDLTAESSDSPELVDMTSLDFDLGLPEEKPAAISPDEPSAGGASNQPEDAADSGALDFDLGSESVFFSKGELDGMEGDVALDREEGNGATSSPPEAGAATVLNSAIGDLEFDIETDVGSRRNAEASEARTMVFEPIPEQSDAVPEDAAGTDDGVEFDVSLTESTFLGRTMLEPSSFDMDSIDLDLNAPELPASPPSRDPSAESESEPSLPSATDTSASVARLDDLDSFDEIQISTSVNPDFANEQAETQVNPQFGVDQEEDMLPEFDISANEEVTTKLDLAKAYEEMGDFEGARELLQEVVKEGDMAQREKAQTILAKIGE